MHLQLVSVVSLLVLAKGAFAACGTHTFTHCADGIVHWYDPLTGEICDPIDCGGGRAPPKTNVPGCAGYTGALPTVSYLSCWTPSASSTAKPATLTTTTKTGSAPTATTTDTAAASGSQSTTQGSPTGTGVTSATSVTGVTGITSPATTPSATLSQSSTGNGSGTASGTASGTTTSGASTPSTNAGSFLDGSMIAVAGAVIGAIALV
jgi:hypothetical protein